MNNLEQFVEKLPSGQVSTLSSLDYLLAEHWNDFHGSTEGGMEGFKLLGRMERVRWKPPIVSFVVERHGGSVMGSTRAELQHWEVNVAEQTARIVKVGHRQLKPMAPRLSIKELAGEIAERILGGHDDTRFKRLEDGSVKVLASKIFPTGSGFERTVSGRRKRLVKYIAETLSHSGWTETGNDLFKPPEN